MGPSDLNSGEKLMKRCTIVPKEHEMADQHELAEQELEIVIGGLTPNNGLRMR
jgi:hypothetical protein